MQHRSMPNIPPRLCVVTCIWFLAEVLHVRETTYGWCLRMGPVIWQHSVDARCGGLQIADAGQDNHWVVKPAQGARSMDLCLTDSEAMIVRMRGAPGGDRVVQKYIPRPVLYKGRKFDLRVLSCSPAS